MSNKRNNLSIIEIRKKSRDLGMSRGRITRNVRIEIASNIRQFQIVFILDEKDKAKMQKEFEKTLFTKSNSNTR